jgi:hypothetical protein
LPAFAPLLFTRFVCFKVSGGISLLTENKINHIFFQPRIKILEGVKKKKERKKKKKQTNNLFNSIQPNSDKNFNTKHRNG